MRTLLLVLFSLCLPFAVVAQKKTAKPEPIPDKPEDLAAEIGELLTEEPSGLPSDPKSLQARWKKTLARVDTLIAAFRKKYPDHALRWDVLYWEANSNDVRAEVGLPKLAGLKPTAEVYAEVAAAADASPDIQVRASFDRVSLFTEQVLEKKLPFADWDKALTEHTTKFPDYGGNHILLEQRVRFLRAHEAPRVMPYLEELAKSTNNETSEMAKKQLAIEKAREAVKAKPFDLKFKAAGGAEVDFEKLRGKVVVLFYWAAWSDPAMAEVAKVQQLQTKFAKQGLEVVGVSVDDEVKDLQAAVKKKKVTWPNHFDGKGWESPLTKPYGVVDLPELWLLNKQGTVVDFDGATDTAAKVEKLLAE